MLLNPYVACIAAEFLTESKGYWILGIIALISVVLIMIAEHIKTDHKKKN